jgi:hypothetical protein
VGYCYAEGRTELTVELTQSDLGAWEIKVSEEHGPPRIRRSYEDELSARRDIENLYAFGRQFGHWRIDRNRSYTPDSSGVPVSPAGREPAQPSKA